jgi:hypothetical protein
MHLTKKNFVFFSCQKSKKWRTMMTVVLWTASVQLGINRIVQPCVADEVTKVARSATESANNDAKPIAKNTGDRAQRDTIFEKQKHQEPYFEQQKHQGPSFEQQKHQGQPLNQEADSEELQTETINWSNAPTEEQFYQGDDELIELHGILYKDGQSFIVWINDFEVSPAQNKQFSIGGTVFRVVSITTSSIRLRGQNGEDARLKISQVYNVHMNKVFNKEDFNYEYKKS